MSLSPQWKRYPEAYLTWKDVKDKLNQLSPEQLEMTALITEGDSEDSDAVIFGVADFGVARKVLRIHGVEASQLDSKQPVVIFSQIP